MDSVLTEKAFTHFQTMFNKNEIYLASLLPITVMTAVCVGQAFHLAGGKHKKLYLIFKRRPTATSPGQ